MKKPSKSPTVLLKQKVKERILTKSAGKVGKSEGPSTASGEEIPADSDVPPAVDLNKEGERLMESLDKAGLKEAFLNPKPESYIPKLEPFPEGMGWNYEPRQTRTICPKCGCLMNFKAIHHPDGSTTDVSSNCPFCSPTPKNPLLDHEKGDFSHIICPDCQKPILSMPHSCPEYKAKTKLLQATSSFLPVENHGSTNDLARSVISKVKSAKPASDLDRLERSQLRGKPKGPSSTRSSE